MNLPTDRRIWRTLFTLLLLVFGAVSYLVGFYNAKAHLAENQQRIAVLADQLRSTQDRLNSANNQLENERFLSLKLMEQIRAMSRENLNREKQTKE